MAQTTKDVFEEGIPFFACLWGCVAAFLTLHTGVHVLISAGVFIVLMLGSCLFLYAEAGRQRGVLAQDATMPTIIFFLFKELVIGTSLWIFKQTRFGNRR